MKRDFTYIGDVLPPFLSVLDAPPAGDAGVPHRIHNVGNNRPDALTDCVAVIERAIGRKAVIEFAPMQPGDVAETCADISALRHDRDFESRTAIADGIPRFVAWYRDHCGV